MDSADRSAVAGVEGFDEVLGFLVANLLDDEPVRAVAKRMANEVADGDVGVILIVESTLRFEAKAVGSRDLKLAGVLDRENPLFLVDQRGQRDEHGGLTGSGAPGDDDVLALVQGPGDESEDFGGKGAAVNKLGGGPGPAALRLWL